MLASGLTAQATLLAALASGGGLGALGAWYSTRRTKTGSITSSEAGELWHAMENHLELLTERADTADARVDKLTGRVNELLERLQGAQRLVERLAVERGRLENQADQLSREVALLKDLNYRLTGRITHLTELLERHDIDLNGGNG